MNKYIHVRRDCMRFYFSQFKSTGQTAAEKPRTFEAGIYPPGRASGNLSGIIYCVSLQVLCCYG